jgi:hypothetical protein
MLVAGERPLGDTAGLLGGDLLSHWDVEFDLGHHAIRLLKPVGCHGDDVVYWTDSYHRAAIEPMTSEHQDIDLDVTLNHRSVEATLDSGAGVSVLTPGVAERIGAKLTSINGRTYGLGAATIPVRVAGVDSFGIGGEEIRNIRLPTADMFAHNAYEQTGSFVQHHLEAEPKILLGADFLRAHRVLVAPDQNQLYFTYEGGQVFGTPPASAPAAPAPSPSAR